MPNLLNFWTKLGKEGFRLRNRNPCEVLEIRTLLYLKGNPIENKLRTKTLDV